MQIHSSHWRVLDWILNTMREAATALIAHIILIQFRHPCGANLVWKRKQSANTLSWHYKLMFDTNATATRNM